MKWKLFLDNFFFCLALLGSPHSSISENSKSLNILSRVFQMTSSVNFYK